MIRRAITILTSLSLAQVAFSEEAQKVLPIRQLKSNTEIVQGLQLQQPRAQQPQIQQPQMRKPVRKIASVSGDRLSTMKVKKGQNAMNPDRDTDIRLGIGGGLSSMKSGIEATQSYREEQKIGQNIMVNVMADARFMTYFGLDLDVYYGIAPTQTIDFGNDDVEKKKLQHMGGMFNVKGQLPFYTDTIRWVPRLGVGYGMLKLNQKTEVESLSETVEASESIKGIYGTVGLDIEPVSWLMIQADYARSLSASGTFNSTSSVGSNEVTLTGAQFDRIRFGVFFRIDPNILLGGQYTRRTMNFSEDSAASGATSAASLIDISNSETLSQIGATLLFQF